MAYKYPLTSVIFWSVTPRSFVDCYQHVEERIVSIVRVQDHNEYLRRENTWILQRTETNGKNRT